MTEIINKILENLLKSFLALIAALIRGWAAIDYFVQKRKEKKHERALAQKQTEKQYNVFW